MALSDLKISILLKSKSLILFFLLTLLLIKLVFGLVKFGFRYTDIDQTIMWNAALDYSNFIFREPYFYGQPYNFMLEALLASPFVWLHIPVYIVLPLVTSIIALFPYLVLAKCFYSRQYFLWTILALSIPIVLPIEYSLLTTLARGFVQAQLFIPLLFIPLFYPFKKQLIPILYLGIGHCYLANPSSAILVIPIFIYIFSYHYYRAAFYLNALWLLPFIAVDMAAKYYYEIHPEIVRVPWVPPYPDMDTFLNSLMRTDHFTYLFPFNADWGMAYFPLLICLI